MKIRKIAAIAASLLLAASVAACSGDKKDDSKATDTTTAAENAASDVEGTLTVYAAASLNKAFPDIAKAFNEKYPKVKVEFNFAGSSTLVEQMQGGAKADVFASADVKNMEKVPDLVPSPEVFTSNTLRLVVPKGNPAKVTGLDSLEGIKFVVCVPQVPCGNLTGQVKEALKFEYTAVSEELKVTDVLAKVETGQGDAGFVYITDAMGGNVDIVDVPDLTKYGTDYMIGTLKDSENADLAKEFMDMVTGEKGQEILKGYGFGKDA